MGLLSDFFAEKVEIWRGYQLEERDAYCGVLKSEHIYHQIVKINQEIPKCDGNCAGCAAMEQVDENTPMYKKIGVGCSVDLLTEKGEHEIYGIYVKKVDEEKVKALFSME